MLWFNAQLVSDQLPNADPGRAAAMAQVIRFLTPTSGTWIDFQLPATGWALPQLAFGSEPGDGSCLSECP